jgi:predicted ATPase
MRLKMGEFVIISGGPGSGKTTLINELENRGYKTFGEVPRQLIVRFLIEDQARLPWNDLKSFAELCLYEMKRQKRETKQSPVSFADRAIADILAYMKIGNLPIPDEYKEEAKTGYNRNVFLLMPQSDFYVQDEVRPHSFSEALEIHHEINNIYNSLGFSVHLISRLSLEDQISFITRTLGL